MSEEQVKPSEEVATPNSTGEGDVFSAPCNDPQKKDGTEPPTEKKRTIFQKVRSIGWQVTKKLALLTAVTSPIRDTPGHDLLCGLQHAGIIPMLGDAQSRERPYRHIADKKFADSIDARPLPESVLQPARINNYVMEPNGEDVPIFILHGEKISFREALSRMNTNLYHGQGVSASFHDTLSKILDRDADVKFIDGLVTEGLIFNGPHIELLKNSKTVVNNSVCISSLDQTRDVSQYKAWIFHAAGNLGDSIDVKPFQSQPGGLVYHGPRSVLIGAPYGYSSRCGPVFYAEPATAGRIKSMESRFTLLPSSADDDVVDEHGRGPVSHGWGGTSNSSPVAAAKFSALMERYGNYLSEEQIFAILCHSVAETTKDRLALQLLQAQASGNTFASAYMTNEVARYHSTTMPGRHAQYFYDPSTHGFGEVTQTALQRADESLQLAVIYSMHNPQAVSKPTTIKAGISLSEMATTSDGMYHYKFRLPRAANLGNVVIQGCVASPDIEREEIYMIANGIKIRIPAATTSPLQEFNITRSETTEFIGSTRGFTGCGPVQEIEIVSRLPLDGKASITCYNTLGANDLVSNLGQLKANVDRLQAGPKPVSLRMARPLDSKRTEPSITPIAATFYPDSVSEAEIALDMQRKAEKEKVPDKQEQEQKFEHTAYWKKEETDPPPREAYIGKMI
jgi:hypothetical protein